MSVHLPHCFQSFVSKERTFRLAGLVVLALLLTSCKGAKRPPSSDVEPVQESIGNENEPAPVANKPPEFWQRIAMQSQSSEGNAERIRLVQRIGDEKVQEAVPLLLQELLNIGPFRVDDFSDFRRTYPCSAALVKIGKVALPQIQAQFKIAKSAREQMVLVDILAEICGAKATADWLQKEFLDGKLVPERRERIETLKHWVLSLSPE